MNDAPAARPRIKVKPGGPDRRVPFEIPKSGYFEQNVATEVFDTPYIRRRLGDGDLIEVDAQGSPAPAPEPVDHGEPG